MDFLKRHFPQKNALLNQIFFRPGHELELHSLKNFPSEALGRTVHIDVFLPPGHFSGSNGAYPTLWINDGQDMPAVGMAATLQRLYQERKLPHIIVVAIHAGDRMQEYGTVSRPDYMKRGSKAPQYTRFLLKELMPELSLRYRISRKAHKTAIAGFSLGGLSAIDIAWNHAGMFGKVGVFSGSLWWRSRAFTPDAPDAHRIVHHMVSQGPRREGLRFWLQAGTKDETEDRNNNGIIDAIDDTLDLIKELKNWGYREGADIKYVEVIGGEHNPDTWGKVMPDFLQWAFGQ
ncbi:MAG: esterase family protein [Phaeodactylibacter sp.]|nr:esterase family protein [Phaeodactylibacter sp.]MCB9302282.1 esterase family protein [Lewinellaceae bacterium]HQU58834.1 alpha/beta hydrolase-fold protein [Saprospiraceae bacterium]